MVHYILHHQDVALPRPLLPFRNALSMTFQGKRRILLAGLSHGWPEEVPLLWGTELIVLQLSTANQDLVGHWAERPKGLTLKLLNEKKKFTQIY